MKVWVIGRNVPAAWNNMTGVFELEQAKMLAAHGVEVVYPVVDLFSLRHRRPLGVRKREEDGVRIMQLSLPIGRAKRVLPDRMVDGIYRAFYRRVMRKYGAPDVAHVHYPARFRYQRLSGLIRSGTAVAATEHWSGVLNGTLSKHEAENLKAFAGNAALFFCVGKPLAEAVSAQTGRTDVRVLPNILSPLFAAVPPRQGVGDPFTFLAVGRLAVEKRYDTLIRAFASAFGPADGARLDIVGGGPQREALEALIAELGCGDRVRLCGLMPREALPEVYRSADALVMTSDYETFGVPVIEAMACGLPVIVPAHVCVASFIDGSRGLVTPDNEEDSVRAALLKMPARAGDYDAGAIAAYAVSHFGEDAIAEALLAAYRGVTENKKGGACAL